MFAPLTEVKSTHHLATGFDQTSEFGRARHCELIDSFPHVTKLTSNRINSVISYRGSARDPKMCDGGTLSGRATASSHGHFEADREERPRAAEDRLPLSSGKEGAKAGKPGRLREVLKRDLGRTPRIWQSGQPGHDGIEVISGQVFINLIAIAITAPILRKLFVGTDCSGDHAKTARRYPRSGARKFTYDGNPKREPRNHIADPIDQQGSYPHREGPSWSMPY